jgi:hypothetical protein
VSLAAIFGAYAAVVEWLLHVELLLLESTRLLWGASHFQILTSRTATWVGVGF